MMESSLKASWWLWWGNPLIQMHPDQKSRLYMPASAVEKLSYSDVESLRTTLGLAPIPEDGVVNAPYYGAVFLCEAVDLLESKQKLPALTFDEGFFKFSQAEWEERFQIQDKDHIRALITFSRSTPEELKPLIKKITLACSDHNRANKLTLLERTQIVLTIFLAFRFPVFSQRWLLNLSDAVLYVIDLVGDLESDVAIQYCNFIENEIPSLTDQIRRRYEVPEIDFKTLADYESQAL